MSHGGEEVNPYQSPQTSNDAIHDYTPRKNDGVLSPVAVLVISTLGIFATVVGALWQVKPFSFALPCGVGAAIVFGVLFYGLALLQEGMSQRPPSSPPSSLN